MNRRDLKTFLMMIVLFAIVFGPILLFAWKDWDEILLFGVRRSSDFVDYVWNALDSPGTPTLFSTATSHSASPTTAAYVFAATDTSARSSAPHTASSTRPPFLSATSDERGGPSQTPTRIPTRTRMPTRIPTRTRTPTRIPTRTATFMGTRTLTPIPSRTPPPPTKTPVPTSTKEPKPTDAPTVVPTAPPPPTQAPTENTPYP
jgi:hypothetical protein